MRVPEFLAPPPAVLQSPLRSQDCADRLRAAIDSDFSLFGDNPVIGAVGDSSASLRKRIRNRNSFQTVMRVKFVDRGAGTEITCRSGMSVFSILFMAVWFGGIGLFAFSTVVWAVETSSLVAAAALLMPLGMIAFGVLLVLAGRLMARNEHAELLAFVTKVTGAKRTALRSPEACSIVN
ncbi:MAG: hypothetical protein Q8L66_08220 [Caulobacter sp.]|nr:hypothetical protein [Caulobacter sp.]